MRDNASPPFALLYETVEPRPEVPAQSDRWGLLLWERGEGFCCLQEELNGAQSHSLRGNSRLILSELPTSFFLIFPSWKEYDLSRTFANLITVSPSSLPFPAVPLFPSPLRLYLREEKRSGFAVCSVVITVIA